MAIINFANREITAKVVYFGAAGAGCNTNVRVLWERIPHKDRSPLHNFGSHDNPERSWFFEYVPEAASAVAGFDVRYRVYSLPGAITFQAHREEVMRSADAVVFIADARRERAQQNMESMLGLEKALKEQGLELSAMPMVIQVNHTDADNARSPEDVTFDLNPYGFAVNGAVARSGIGVAETHAEVTSALVARVRDNMAGNEAAITLTAVHRAKTETAEDVIASHIEVIRKAGGHLIDETEDPMSDFEELAGLPEGGTAEVAFQPRDYAGMRPTRILDTHIDKNTVHLELVMERLSGGEPRRLTVILANRPTDTPAVRRSPQPMKATREDFVTANLPDVIPLTPEPGEETIDMPPVIYGILGVSGGVIIGLLLGYLVQGLL